MNSPHIPVLLNEVLELAKKVKDGNFLDCTLGYGGHSYNILNQNENINLIACDQDDEAIEFSKEFLKKYENRVKIYKSNFEDIFDKIEIKNIKMILADIGVSSLQLDKNDRGFSIKSDFLDMRMDKSKEFSAKDVVNSYSLEKLEYIFKEYADLKDAKKIATQIISARINKEITSSKFLANLIDCNNKNNRNILKSKLVFQAIRIEVNKELEVLKNFLAKIENLNLKDCYLVIITFHSLEDKIVKKFFKKWSKDCICDENVFKCCCGNDNSKGKIITKKPITPSEDEKKQNPRSSCAKMRIFYFY